MNLWQLLIPPGVQVENCPDLFWRRRQHVQIVEGSLISETAQVSVARHLLVSLLSTGDEIKS